MSSNPTTLSDTLAELARLHDAAQNAPWIAVDHFGGENWLVCGCGSTYDGKDWHVTTDRVRVSEHNGGDAADDAKLIAAMRNAMPRILAEVPALLRVAEAAEEWRQKPEAWGRGQEIVNALDALREACRD